MPKLLVVDDETFIRMLYKKEFESDGYEVSLASNTDEALNMMETQQPELVILDIELGNESWLVAGILPGVERQPLKKLAADENELLKLLQRW